MTREANAPWRDKGTLRQKYWVEGKSLSEVGDELGCSSGTVRKWLNRYDLGTRSQPGDKDADYRDPELLERLYCEKGLSTIKIADRLGCSKQTVQKWMGRHGIETRTSLHDKNGCFFTDPEGYEQFAVTQDYETVNVPVHRLIAISEGKLEPGKIKRNGVDVHHKNGVKWDNRPENLEVLSVAEHARLHAPERERSDAGDFA